MDALQIDSLSRRFGDVVALDDVSLEVDHGAICGFVGANGAGKTTTMRIVMGVDDADSGEVRWHGSRPDAAVRRRFGYMPEERGLYPKMRALDQLVYLARLHGVDSRSATSMASSLLERFGLGGRARDPVEELSLGNQQRVQLAAALVHDPDLLVLDEPFNGLDPVGVDELAEVLREAADGGTPILFSSHQLDLVDRLCDTVTIIDKGRVLASGSVASLRQGDEHLVRVAVRGTDGVWKPAMAGVDVIERNGEEVLLRLGRGVDDQRVLDDARAHGSVVTFTRDALTLAQRYRQVIGA